MIFTNIPWTQVVLALCGICTLLVALATLIWKGAGLAKNVELIMDNHLPHLDAKINMILDHFGIPRPKE